ncbi:MAG: CHAD domain-containing protein [Candidatus Eisenbacteria bacterium]|nr:CHAD domain-containing protein [Candidatus Eisenbacteria bacterium]
MAAHEEIEWQFEADDLHAVERRLEAAAASDPACALSAPRDVELLDHYFDTPELRLLRAGYAVRLRFGQGAPILTMKQLRRATDGLSRRREAEQPVPLQGARLEDDREGDGETSASATAAFAAALRLPGPVSEELSGMIGPRHPRQMFALRQSRRIRTLTRDGVEIAEVALDRTAVVTDASIGEPLLRVEIEVREESELERLTQLVGRLREDLGLRLPRIAKFRAGLAGAGIDPEQLFDVGPLDHSLHPAAHELAYVALRRQLVALLRREPGTRSGRDIEELHQMRVATRRIRAALSLFAEVLPAGVLRERERFRLLGRALGAVRDLDVLGEAIAAARDAEFRDEVGREQLDQLATLILLRRERAHTRLRRVLDAPAFSRLVERFARRLKRGAPAFNPPLGSVTTAEPLKAELDEAGPTGTGLAAAERPVPDAPARGRLLPAAREFLGVWIERRRRKLRRRLEEVRQSAPVTELHAARIAGKKLRYAIEFSAGLYGAAAGRYARRLVALQDLLGVVQDAEVGTAILRDLMRREGRDRETRVAAGVVLERYRRSVVRSRRDLERHARRLRGRRWRALRTQLHATASSEGVA